MLTVRLPARQLKRIPASTLPSLHPSPQFSGTALPNILLAQDFTPAIRGIQAEPRPGYAENALTLLMFEPTRAGTMTITASPNN